MIQYLYFYSSTQGKYFRQHWLFVALFLKPPKCVITVLFMTLLCCRTLVIVIFHLRWIDRRRWEVARRYWWYKKVGYATEAQEMHTFNGDTACVDRDFYWCHHWLCYIHRLLFIHFRTRRRFHLGLLFLRVLATYKALLPADYCSLCSDTVSMAFTRGRQVDRRECKCVCGQCARPFKGSKNHLYSVSAAYFASSCWMAVAFVASPAVN